MQRMKEQELQLELLQNKVGIPKGYSYMHVIKHDFKIEVTEERANRLRQVWNLKQFNSEDLNLLIKVCKHFKDKV